jgi:hypothetical protein
MKKVFKQALSPATTFCFSLFLLLVSAPLHVAFAASNWSEGQGKCVVNGIATIQGLQCLLANVLSYVVAGLGLVGFVMIIVGAFSYLISGGSSKGVEGGRQTITFAIIGLVVALSAFIILQFVASFTGVSSILKFQVPSSNDKF